MQVWKKEEVMTYDAHRLGGDLRRAENRSRNRRADFESEMFLKKGFMGWYQATKQTLV